MCPNSGPAQDLTVAIDGRVLSDHYPGLGRYVYNLVEALGRTYPHDRFVVLTSSDTGSSRYGPASIEASNVRVVADRVPGLRSLTGLVSGSNILAEPDILAEIGADVYHATFWIGLRARGVPTVATLYDVIGLTSAGGLSLPRRLVLRWAARRMARRAVRVLAISEHAGEGLALKLGVPRANLRVTPLGVSDHFRPRSPEVIQRSRLELGLPESFALYVGSNKPHKNLTTLVDAWSGPAAPEVPLLVAGPWDSRFAAPRHTAEGRDLQIVWMGEVREDDLPGLYGAASVFVFPSLHEGFGLPALEAMACGTPVVAADTSSLPEVVGDAGLLVDPLDPSVWADSVRQVVDDPSLAARRRSRGLARATRFSWRATAQATMAAYREAAGRS